MKRGQAPRLVAVDGTALAYRSHFAFIDRPLTTRDGEVTSAVFGFILTLQRIVEALAPDRLVVVFDPVGPTFRHQVFPEYKATRERMPPDLRSQLPRIFQYLDAAGIPRLAVDGFEADDVLATLAEKAREAGLRATIVSNDKDLLQMVGGHVEVVALGRGTEPLRRLGPAEVRESFGVDPGQIVDYLALTGDSSDNVPGVPGVGKKTASKLLGEHGTLDALLDAAASLPAGKLRENLLAARDVALRSRSLVSLVKDVEVPSPETFEVRAPDAVALHALFDELDFRTLKVDVPTARPVDRAGHAAVEDGKALDAAVAAVRAAGRFAFTVIAGEGHALRAELLGVALAAEGGRAWYVRLGGAGSSGIEPQARAALAGLFADARLPKWGHDVKRALAILRRRGVDVEGVDFDTMLASYVLDPSRRAHSTEVLARERLDLDGAARERVTGTGRGRVALDEAPAAELAAWATETADVTFRLREPLAAELAAQRLERILDEVEMPLTRVLLRMEENGVRLDTAYLATLSREMEREIGELERRACEAAGEEFNLGSPKQVAELLFGKLGLKPLRRTKTGHSTDAEVLQALVSEHEVVGLVLRHREVSKLKSTYVDALPSMVDPRTGRVHTTYQQAVAATGRLSSAEPNLQNVPVRTEEGRRIRKAFVGAEQGWLVLSCDYSQIELRILAHMAEDEPLIEAFREDRDVHRATAARVFDVAEENVTAVQREQAKTINYAVLYGMGAVNLGKSLGIPTREASRFIDSYFERHPGVARFVAETQERARETLYVETLLGRRRPVPEIGSRDHRTRAFGERIAVNTPIQGTAADIMKLAMIRVQEDLDRRRLRARLVLTVHDELVLDCPAEERDAVTEIVRSGMEEAMPLSVPLKVDAGSGRDWSEAH
jgi:DNA polymerase-1